MFKKFVEANYAMLECFEKVNADDFKGSDLSKTANICSKEKSQVQALLSSNSMTMTRNVQDRIAILKKLTLQQQKEGFVVDEPITRYQ